MKLRLDIEDWVAAHPYLADPVRAQRWADTGVVLAGFFVVVAAISRWIDVEESHASYLVALKWTAVLIALILIARDRRATIMGIAGVICIKSAGAAIFGGDPRLWNIVAISAAIFAVLIFTAPKGWLPELVYDEKRYAPAAPTVLAQRKNVSVIFLAGLLLILAVLSVRNILSEGYVLQHSASPDKKTIVEIRGYDNVVATDMYSLRVELRRTLNPFRHTAFSGLNYGAKLSVSWVDATHLGVACVDCQNFRIDTLEHQWNGISIHYPPELLARWRVDRERAAKQ